jgi:hypothetical protein
VLFRSTNTLVLVHRRPLLDQWVAQLAMFLGLEEADIGHIGGGKRKPNGRLDVAMLQSLSREGSRSRSCSRHADRRSCYGGGAILVTRARARSDECPLVAFLSLDEQTPQLRPNRRCGSMGRLLMCRAGDMMLVDAL